MATELEKAALIHARVAALRQYAGTEPINHLVSLLDAMKAQYMEELAEISPDDLRLKQGALRQVMALRKSLTDDIGDVPRV